MSRDRRVISWRVKVPYTVFVAVLLPVYVRVYGWGNLLWFSDVALLLTLVALWMESRLVLSIMALSAILPELAWNVDYFARLIFGSHLTGQTEYMFDSQLSLFVRGLSLFHIMLPVLLVWAVHRLGYDRRALLYQVLLCWAVLLATYLWTDPADNINYVFTPPLERAWLTQKLWLFMLMIGFPMLVYVPTHLVLRRVMRCHETPPQPWPSQFGWSSRIILFLVLVLGTLVFPLGCTTTVRPPTVAPGSIADPVTVWLLDHGRTPSLILPDEQGGMIRYSYGDWDYYALRETGFLDGVRALLWPTQGALGRMPMSGPLTAENIDHQVKVGIERMHPVQVERAAVERLRKRLESLYAANQASEVMTRSVDLAFVHHPRKYSYFHNSNHRIAAWMKELGCEIDGLAYYSRWELAEAKESS